MKRSALLVVLAMAATASLTGASRAQDAVDKAKAAAFDNRMFAGPLGQKTYACFVRRYDASHLAQHPKQKVSAMKLLVTAENAPEERPSIIRSVSASNIATGRAISTPAAFAVMSLPKNPAMKSASAAASIARAAASKSRCRRTTSPR